MLNRFQWAAGLIIQLWVNSLKNNSAERHDGRDAAILRYREQVCEAAKQRYPERWSGTTRNWNLKDEVWLNQERNQPEALMKAA